MSQFFLFFSCSFFLLVEEITKTQPTRVVIHVSLSSLSSLSSFSSFSSSYFPQKIEQITGTNKIWSVSGLQLKKINILKRQD